MEGPNGPVPGNARNRSASERFDTTHWTVIFDAGHRGSARAPKALEKLCQQYWPPLYGFARRKGYLEEDAKDLTQAFFAQFIRQDMAETADPARGRFRTFLLTSFDRFIIGEWKKTQTLKRGGPTRTAAEPLHPVGSMAEPDSCPADSALFDRAWAEETFAAALARLREEFAVAGQAEHFRQLQPFLSQPGDRENYAAAAKKLAMKPESVAVAVHRLRHRYSELVRAEVSRIVSPEEIEAELKYLIEVMVR